MRRTLGLALALCLAFAGSAQAASITINAGAGLSGNAAALAAFNRAATTLNTLFSDPILVTIDADLAALGPGIIGSTGSVMLQAGYDTIRNQMVTDAADEADDAIVAALPTAAGFTTFVPAGFSLDGFIALTKANAKALGFTGLDVQFGVSDADITFSSAFGFDYDNSNGVGAGLIDFETVALHELVHALGFISAVDDVDFLLGVGQTARISPTTLDLFRFRSINLPTTTAQFTSNARSLVPGLAAFTSDVTNSWGMSTGQLTGDGNQASHWKADDITGNLIGVMDPTLGFATFYGMTAPDIRALDLIGWDFVPNQAVEAVPEPASMVLLGSGLAAVVRFRRRRQSQI